MSYLYSKTTGSVYLSQLGGTIPDDAIEIDTETYRRVFASPPSGKIAATDERGWPILIDVVVPEVNPGEILTMQAAEGRIWRDDEISRVSWLRDRHRDELELGKETSITADQYVELLAFIQSLRDWPQGDTFPAEASRPVVPDWVVTQS